MPALAKNAVFTPIPVQLSDTEFNEFILPHLSMPKRGPKCKLGYYRGTTPILTSWRRWRDRPLLSFSKWASAGLTIRGMRMVDTTPSGSRPAKMGTGVYSFATISACGSGTSGHVTRLVHPSHDDLKASVLMGLKKYDSPI
jgi:hypothetical protein